VSASLLYQRIQSALPAQPSGWARPGRLPGTWEGEGDLLAFHLDRFIGQTFKDNAATGARASIHGWNPLPAYAYDAEFGKGARGRY